MKNDFIKQLDKDQIPICNILGVNIAAINMEWLIDYTKKNIYKLSGDYMCVSNVHTTVMSYESSNYRNIQNDAILAIPDGAPLSFIGSRCGYKNMKRTTGPSYMQKILEIGVEKGYKHYFYGSTQETLDKIKIKLEHNYPNIKIVGMYSPPFRLMTEKEDENLINIINKADPDFIWVGLGAPKQEIWMSSHQGKIKGFMVGVGAGFDYLSGNIKRAPIWMQKLSLEWLYRLFQDPKRLFKRYLITNFKFIWYIVIRRENNEK